MADAVTQVPADSTGDKIDMESLTVGANTVHRQRVQVTGTAAADIAPVDATAGVKVDLGADNDVNVNDALYSAAEAGALPSEFVVVAADDGTDVIPLQADATSGDLKVTLDSEEVAINDGGNVISVDDAAGSLTVDNAALSVTGGGTEASALRVTVANDSTGVVSVDDNGGSLTVDATDLDVRDLAATQDTVTAKLATDAIQDGTTALTPKFASIDAASSGDNTIVSAVASKKIRVLQYALVASAATTVTWKSATAGAVTGGMQLAANGGVEASFCPVGLFETTAGEALVLNLSAANSVDGHLVYVEV